MEYFKLKFYGGDMIKKVAIFLSLICLLGGTLLQPSEAFFIKKKKIVNKQVTEAVDESITKVLVVEIYAGWCPACRNIQPTLDLLQKEEPNIKFVQLDVSTPSKATKSAELANGLNIVDFYKLNKSKTSTVGVFKPSSRKLVAVFQNNNEIDDYKEAIQKALEPEST
ncbi:MAG: thioredoxin family protein [Candidatus Melainabacteria bacterium]|nr:thioredoxin family protein [Candidatus Melainabacteria bacterium]